MIQKARLTFFGTGTSQGVPIIGCRCPVCSSGDSKNKRFRSSALVDYCGVRILVDAGPDFRMQMLRLGIDVGKYVIFKFLCHGANKLTSKQAQNYHKPI